MKKTDFQRICSFMKKHQLSHQDIKKISTEYANSPEEKARTFFTEKYKISEHVFYKCLEFSIVCHLVDETTRKMIRAKAISNYKLHNEKESSKKVMDHYAELTRRRKIFFDAIPKEEILDISYKYAAGIELSIISNTYGYCEETVKKLIAKGITKVITPLLVVILIKNRVKTEGKSLEDFEKLEQKRSNVRARALKPFEDEIKMLKFQIEHFDEYFEGDVFFSKKDFLENRLQELIKKYEYWLDF